MLEHLLETSSSPANLPLHLCKTPLRPTSPPKLTGFGHLQLNRRLEMNPGPLDADFDALALMEISQHGNHLLAIAHHLIVQSNNNVTHLEPGLFGTQSRQDFADFGKRGAEVELDAEQSARRPYAAWQSADDADGVGRWADAWSNRPRTDGNSFRSPLYRLQVSRMNTHEGHILLWIGPEQFGAGF